MRCAHFACHQCTDTDLAAANRRVKELEAKYAASIEHLGEWDRSLERRDAWARRWKALAKELWRLLNSRPDGRDGVYWCSRAHAADSRLAQAEALLKEARGITTSLSSFALMASIDAFLAEKK